MMVQRLNMATQRVINIADAEQPTDALNRRSGDARYLQLTGGSVNGSLSVGGSLTTDMTVGDNDWHELGPVRFTINRGGQSLVAVTVTGNLNLPQSNMLVLGFDVGGASGTVQRNVWLYGYAAATDVGFAAVLIVQQNTPVVDFPVRVKWLGGQPGQDAGQWPAFTIRGGPPGELLRTQIVITDLGPALSAQEETSHDDNPSIH
jgi:hypothetical protein